MKKVGLLGGSFDPIHLGHIAIAQLAIEKLELDEVWYIVSFQTNLKDDLVADISSRLDMANIAIRNDKRLKICDIERDLPTPSYTINTIVALKEKYEDCDFTFLIGSDQADQLDKWHRIDELKEMVEFKVISRDGKQGDIYVPEGTYPQSSTAIRAGVIEYLDDEVWKYIVNHEIYLETIVASKLTEKRFAHTLNTVEVALSLSLVHKYDRHLTYLAALFHDIAKQESEEFLLSYLDQKEKTQPQGIWHQYVGAKLVKDYYKISNQDVFDAIYNHTTGDCDSILAMIIFCADKIEPSRQYDSNEVFMLCVNDIKQGFQIIKSNHKEYTISRLADCLGVDGDDLP